MHLLSSFPIGPSQERKNISVSKKYLSAKKKQKDFLT